MSRIDNEHSCRFCTHFKKGSELIVGKLWLGECGRKLKKIQSDDPACKDFESNLVDDDWEHWWNNYV